MVACLLGPPNNLTLSVQHALNIIKPKGDNPCIPALDDFTFWGFGWWRQWLCLSAPSLLCMSILQAGFVVASCTYLIQVYRGLTVWHPEQIPLFCGSHICHLWDILIMLLSLSLVVCPLVSLVLPSSMPCPRPFEDDLPGILDEALCRNLPGSAEVCRGQSLL